MPQEKPIESVEIEEKQGGMPRWGWILIMICMVYALLIGPFSWFNP